MLLVFGLFLHYLSICICHCDGKKTPNINTFIFSLNWNQHFINISLKSWAVFLLWHTRAWSLFWKASKLVRRTNNNEIKWHSTRIKPDFTGIKPDSLLSWYWHWRNWDYLNRTLPGGVKIQKRKNWRQNKNCQPLSLKARTSSTALLPAKSKTVIKNMQTPPISKYRPSEHTHTHSV